MKVVQRLANHYEDIEVAVVLDKSLISQKLESHKSLVLHRNFDDGVKVLSLDAELNLEIMTQFTDAHKFPLVSEFD